MNFNNMATTSNTDVVEMKKEESNVPMEVSGLDSRYECPICLSCLKEPVLTSCGHRFCGNCLTAWLDGKGFCPVDNIKLDKSRDVFPDLFTRREILSQRTFCRICNADISINELDEHLMKHTSENGRGDSDVHCPFRSIGCLMEVPKERMTEHLELQIHHHLCLIQESHLKLLKSSGEKRLTALSQEAALWEPSEKGKTPGMSEEPLMRALYERVVILEQRCHEQDAQIQRLRSDLASTENKFHEFSALYACGQFLWNIRQFSEKLSAMRRIGRRLFFSQAFYTSPVGYKICGRINVSPNNDDQLALLIHLMKSENDSALEWPFNGRIHLSVIHPTNPDLTVSETMMSRPELEAFKRPVRDMNTKAFGYPQFISITDILTKGFLNSDTLIVKIRIQCV